MAIDVFYTIGSIANDSGWEVSPKKISEHTVELSSALHHFTCRVTVDGRGYNLSFTSTVLQNELSRIMPDVFDQPIVVDDILLKVLKEASVLAFALPDSPLIEYETEVKRLSLDGTTVRREVEQRVGQDVFRRSMLSYWGNRCALTGVGTAELLLASHAKPWKDCASDEERLNVFNGFLLEARFDRLFDQGYITFDDQGMILISKVLDGETVQNLGIVEDMRLRWIQENHLIFLHWHREHVFRR